MPICRRQAGRQLEQRRPAAHSTSVSANAARAAPRATPAGIILVPPDERARHCYADALQQVANHVDDGATQVDVAVVVAVGMRVAMRVAVGLALAAAPQRVSAIMRMIVLVLGASCGGGLARRSALLHQHHAAGCRLHAVASHPLLQAGAVLAALLAVPVAAVTAVRVLVLLLLLLLGVGRRIAGMHTASSAELVRVAVILLAVAVRAVVMRVAVPVPVVVAPQDGHHQQVDPNTHHRHDEHDCKVGARSGRV